MTDFCIAYNKEDIVLQDEQLDNMTPEGKLVIPKNTKWEFTRFPWGEDYDPQINGEYDFYFPEKDRNFNDFVYEYVALNGDLELTEDMFTV